MAFALRRQSVYVNALTFYYLGRRLQRAHVRILPRLCEAIIYFGFNCSIPLSTEIGPGCRCEHRGIGVVIHERARVGARCVFHAQAVLGGPGGGRSGAPTVGDDVIIGVGAKLLGPIHVGDRAVIGANAVVLQDVPDDATAVGVPARNIQGGVARRRTIIPAEGLGNVERRGKSEPPCAKRSSHCPGAVGDD